MVSLGRPRSDDDMAGPSRGRQTLVRWSGCPGSTIIVRWNRSDTSRPRRAKPITILNSPSGPCRSASTKQASRPGCHFREDDHARRPLRDCAPRNQHQSPTRLDSRIRRVASRARSARGSRCADRDVGEWGARRHRPKGSRRMALVPFPPASFLDGRPDAWMDVPGARTLLAGWQRIEALNPKDWPKDHAELLELVADASPGALMPDQLVKSLEKSARSFNSTTSC